MTDFEQYFKETSLGYELIHISSEEVVFRKDKDGRYLEPSVSRFHNTWVSVNTAMYVLKNEFDIPSDFLEAIDSNMRKYFMNLTVDSESILHRVKTSMNRTDIVLVPKNHLEKSIGFMTTAQCHPSNSNEYEVSIDETIDVFSKILEQSNES